MEYTKEECEHTIVNLSVELQKTNKELEKLHDKQNSIKRALLAWVEKYTSITEK